MKAAAIATICAGLVLAVPALSAQNNASPADRNFVKTAMQGSMAEIQLGQMATEKAGSDSVRQFGQKMVQDHTQLNQQMQPVAQEVGVTAPDHLSPAQKALKTKLQGMSGAAFDKAYMKAMVKDHTRDLAEFRKEASTGKSPAVKQAAEKGSKVIAEHLQLAKQTAKEVGVLPGQKRANDSSLTQ